MKKDILENKFEELKNEMSDTYALDFANNYGVSDSNYICDAITEFADNNTSIYYSEQREYYNDNPEECERALLELYDPESIADFIKDSGLDSLICKAGALGEYEAISGEIYEELENIILYIIIGYLLDADRESLFDSLEDLEEFASQFDHNNRFDDIADKLDEKEEENEE